VHKLVPPKVAPPALGLALTAMAAVGLGVVVYFASTSLAWFASSPTSDPTFGALNHCLMAQVPADRAGFAVSPDASRAATFSDRGLGVCEDGAGSFLPLPGIVRAAWDFDGVLWLAVKGPEAKAAALYRRRGSAPLEPVGDIAPVALAGHARGVAALDRSGRLVSLAADGQVLGVFDLPTRPDDTATLVADAAGALVAVVMHNAVWIFEAQDLSWVRGESPCDAEYLWWLPAPGAALVSCGPDQSWALSWQATTGTREAAPRKQRVHSALLARAGVYVRGCEGLPCTAPAP
jgi:hypothetical protein